MPRRLILLNTLPSESFTDDLQVERNLCCLSEAATDCSGYEALLKRFCSSSSISSAAVAAPSTPASCADIAAARSRYPADARTWASASRIISAVASAGRARPIFHSSAALALMG